jgi:hypothetical protein
MRPCKIKTRDRIAGMSSVCATQEHAQAVVQSQ